MMKFNYAKFKTKAEMTNLLDRIEFHLKEGWSVNYSLGQVGLKYSNHSFISRVLNFNLRYRTLIIEYNPKATNIKKWIKEFNDLPENHKYRSRHDYVLAIQKAIKFQSQRTRAIGYRSRMLSRDVERGLVGIVCEEVPKDRFKSNTLHGFSPKEPSLPKGLQTIS